jgi:hypothetical protein
MEEVMSRGIKKFIAILMMAGILLTPACYNTDDASSPKGGTTTGSTVSPGASPGSTGQGSENSGSSPTASADNKGKVDVITNEEELEEYFNTISDQDIENLLKIIEDIDVTDDVNPDADPGFDQVEIP